MNDPDIKTAITVLTNRIRSKEEEVNGLKRTVNDMARDAGQEPPYPHVASSDNAGDISSLRPDQFYGMTIGVAARAYLEMRKGGGGGAAMVNDIYAALCAGGYKFETSDETNRKNGLRISLRKNPSIFHQLPNGNYGLTVWYPRVKTGNGDDDSPAKKHKSTVRVRIKAKSSSGAKNPTLKLTGKKKSSGASPDQPEEEIPF